MLLKGTYVRKCVRVYCMCVWDEMFMIVLGLTFTAVIALVPCVGAVTDGLVVDQVAHPSVLALVVWPAARCHCDAL